jgi:hypothetical protein
MTKLNHGKFKKSLRGICPEAKPLAETLGSVLLVQAKRSDSMDLENDDSVFCHKAKNQPYYRYKKCASAPFESFRLKNNASLKFIYSF